ncbi:MAG: GNAT family N-acetyltransferase [Polymorphobacter sp.]
MIPIRLVPFGRQALANIAADPDWFQVFPGGGDVRDLVQDIAVEQAALYDRTDAAPPWIGYLGCDANDGAIRGFCSFVGNPAGGSVEIAYLTFPDWQESGVATGMAKALVQIGRDSGVLSGVHAFTLPEINASTRLLARQGFLMTGGAVDADVGPVWRWDLKF